MGAQEAPSLPKRTCGGCFYWRRGWLDFSEGYATAICNFEGDSRPRERRASDYCSNWQKYEKPHGELLLLLAH